MSRFPLARALAVVGCAALVAVLPAAPALASAAPTAATSLSYTIQDDGAHLTWVDGNGTGAIVRDVSQATAPYDSASSGRLVTGNTATSVVDAGIDNHHGTTYAIWSTSSDNTPAAAPLVSVISLPTTLTLQISNTKLPYGQPLNAVGYLTRQAGSASLPVAGAAVTLVAVEGGTTAVKVVQHLTTDASGKVFATVKPYRTVALHLVYAGDVFDGASTSPTRTLQLLPLVSAAASPTTIVQKETTTISGHVTPAYVNARVLLQSYGAGTWHSLLEGRTNSAGNYAFTITPAVGPHLYRALLTGTVAYGQSNSNFASMRVDARDLVYGSTGDDVLALKRSLVALHFNVGALNSTFDQDLKHAVIAFEKLNGLPRIGKWTHVERLRATHPTVYTVRYGSSGRAVEVDVTRQILVYSVNHVVTLIADVSTGGEYHYTYKGVTYLAHTPRGRFVVERKIDGVRISNLGYLYRPSYFSGGYAIHGEAYDVPVKPASHGCVRVTNHIADVLFAQLPKGTPVTVFDE